MNPSFRHASVVAALLALGAHAHAGTETRQVADFNAVSMSGSFDVDITQGGRTSVQVQADDKLLPLIETVVEGGRLQIRLRKGETMWSYGKVTVTVVTPALNALSIAGSGDAKVHALNTDQFAVSIAGAGDLHADGRATRLTVSIAGSGDVALRDLRADDVTVKIAGSGDAAVNAQKTLNVSIAGSGDVTYSGDPVLKRSVAGSGSVTRR